MFARAVSNSNRGLGSQTGDTASPQCVRQRLSGKTVLIVEDELLTGISIRMDAERTGAIVIGPTATLQGTFLAIADSYVDVAILDVKLADAEVFPVADHLYDQGVPIVFHTGHARKTSLQARYPASRIFTKSTASIDLLKAAASMLNQAGQAS